MLSASDPAVPAERAVRQRVRRPQLMRDSLGACMTQGHSTVFVRFLLGLPVLLAAFAILFYKVFAPDCDSTLVAEFPAPHRLVKASISVRKCRVAQRFTTHVSLLEARQSELPPAPNILAVEGGTFYGRSSGAPEVAVIWSNDSALIVRYDTTRPAIRSASYLDGVAIQFEDLSRQAPN